MVRRIIARMTNALRFSPSLLRGACALALGLGCGAAAWAQSQTPPPSAKPAPVRTALDAPAPTESQTHYVLGLILGNGPDYAGGDGRKTSVRPAWAIQHGRFRLSTGRGSTLMGHGLTKRDEGASATLAESDDFNLSASLRIDNGRDAGDSARLVGLPEVRRTLRGRLGASYSLGEHWSIGASWSQDLLGRDGGGQLSASLGYARPLSAQTKLSWGMGSSWGDGTYMRSRYGVSGGLSPLPNYTPASGWYSADMGVELMTAINRHWVAFAGVGVSRQLGEARRSPLTVEPVGYSASVGLAYRCCK